MDDLTSALEARAGRPAMELVAALIHKAGGEVELSERNFREAKGLRINRYEIGGNMGFLLRLVDPNAPVDGGFYWVRITTPTAAWHMCQFRNRHWWIPGASVAVEHVAEIGPRIEPPDTKTEPMAAKPPAGYRKLADGVRCTCAGLWQDKSGALYCCTLGEDRTARTTARGVELPD